MSDLLLISGATPRMMDRLTAEFTVHDIQTIDDMPTFLAEHGPKITAVATDGHLGVRADIMDGLPNLKIIGVYGVGYDGVDTKTAAERGIVVTHTPNVLNAEVANTTLMLMLATYRQLRFNEDWVRSGNWKTKGNAPLSRSPDNRTIGILGMGRIGQMIAERLQVFNPTILYHTRTAKDVPYTHVPNLVDMAEQADVLVVITPGGAATHHLVNADVLNALGPDGLLINVARGSVVDEDALVAALADGRLGMAGLDVFDAEPHVPEALLTMDNVVLQPHVGSGTIETRQAMGDLVCDNLSQYLKDGTTLTSVPETAHL